MTCDTCAVLDRIREIVKGPMMTLAGMQQALAEVYRLIESLKREPRDQIAGNYVPGLEP